MALAAQRALGALKKRYQKVLKQRARKRHLRQHTSTLQQFEPREAPGGVLPVLTSLLGSQLAIGALQPAAEYRQSPGQASDEPARRRRLNYSTEDTTHLPIFVSLPQASAN